MTDEQFLSLFQATFHDLGFGKDLSTRVLLFHQSLQTSHPAFPAVMRGGEIYMQFVNGNRTIPLAAGTLIAEFRSEEHTSELQSLMSISYAVFCLQNTKTD